MSDDIERFRDSAWRGAVPKNPSNQFYAWSKATMIGYYSLDVDRNYLADSSKLRYYKPPAEDTVTLDLNAGRETVVPWNKQKEIEEGISSLLHWITQNQETLRAPRSTGRLLKPNFVCTAGLLKTLSFAPYKLFDNWRILAAKWKGTIYLLKDKKKDDDYMQREVLSSWGKKFEQYVMSESPDKDPDPGKPMKEPEEFRGVYCHEFCEHSILYSSVIKGVVSDEKLQDPLDMRNMRIVGLRTIRRIENAALERKFVKWLTMDEWMKGWLTNVEAVVIGFRDDSGVVTKIARYEIHDLLRIGQQHWKPEACVKCCRTFLDKLVECVEDECDETIYEFTRLSAEDFNIVELTPSKENCVLPQSFMDAVG